MGLDERLAYFILGAVCGLIVGYIIRSLRDIERKVDRVDKRTKRRDEGGFATLPSGPRFDRFREFASRINWRSVALFLVVAFTVIASFQSQVASNDVQKNGEEDRKTQARISRITVCNSQFLGQTILALNERTQYSTQQAAANVDLQREQLRLLTIALTIPPPDPADGLAATERYLEKLNKFIELATKTRVKTTANKYPTLDDFNQCVEQNKEMIR